MDPVSIEVLQNKIIAFIKDYFQIHDQEISGDCRLKRDLGLSSFELLEMYCNMEEALGIDIKESEFGRFSTISDVAKYIERNSYL
ncbi:MAG: acyl carrier protein [Clostridiales bacterium]|jgi:acyl carrier protein|nr:acyl carrier protein [Clostridiales bacterium]